MMKIQRAFRGKLARARDRLREKLTREKEAQEKEMREKIERRKRQREEAANPSPSPAPAPPPPDVAPGLPGLPALPVGAEGEEPLRGSLTSRARASHLSRPEAPPRPQTAEAEVQVDVEELREEAALRSVSRQSLFVPLGGEGGEGEEEVGVDAHTLQDQHLRVMAGLAAMGERKWGRGKGVGRGEGEALAFRVGSVGPPQYLSQGLWQRMFGGGGEEVEDEDWEAVIHLPLPAAYAVGIQ